MAKKTVIKKLTKTLDDMVAAAPAEPMTAREIATAKAKKKAKGATDKRAAKAAAKRAAPMKKAKKSNRFRRA